MTTIFDHFRLNTTVAQNIAQGPVMPDPNEYEGVFGGQNIAMSPKYNTNNKSVDYMARLFVPLPNIAARTRFLDSINNGSGDAKQAEAKRIAEVLAISGGTFGETGSGYIDFLLTQAQESYSEKVQISEVLSDNFISYFFGASPPVFNYTGVLYNTLQNDWRSAFSILYHQVIRGTQLARRKVSLCLAYDNVIVTGAMLNMNQSLDASQQMAASFSFSLLVKQYYIWRPDNSPVTNMSPKAKFLQEPATKGMLAGLTNIVSVSSTKLPASQITVGDAARSTIPAAQAADTVDDDKTTKNENMTNYSPAQPIPSPSEAFNIVKSWAQKSIYPLPFTDQANSSTP